MKIEKIKSWTSLVLLANYFPPLHGLRVLAILLVVQVHVTDYMHRAFFLPRYSTLGTIASARAVFGMDFFFMLSGFLIGMILLYSIEKQKNMRYFARFYIRRAFRILPLYYCTLLLFIAIYGLTEFQTERLWREFLYLSNYPFEEHYVMHWSWSLSVEEHFYLAVPFFMVFLKLFPSHTIRLWVLLGLWSTGWVVRYLCIKDFQHVYQFNLVMEVYATTHARYDIFVIGIFTAYIQKYYEANIRQLLSYRWAKWLFLILPLGLLGVMAYPAFPYTNTWTNPFVSWQLFFALSLGTLTGIAYTMLVLWFLHVPTRLADFLGSKFFLVTASLGYGVYLVHLPILRDIVLPFLRAYYAPGISSFWWYWTLALSGTMLISMAVSYVLHILCEKPFLYVRDRIAP